MKILLTNNHLHSFGGTETWVLTVYNILKEMGHDVTVFTFKIGGASKYMENVTTIMPNTEFDLALVNHKTCLLELKMNGNAKHIRFISHGTIPSLEQPMPLADDYVSISKEVKDHLFDLGYKSKVILNPINLKELRPITKLNKKPKSLFVLCQNAYAQENIDKMGFETFKISASYGDRGRLYHTTYNLSDGIVGLGRSAFEGLACGRPVIVYDNRSYNKNAGYDGVITHENIESLLAKNCSGRVNRIKFNPIIVREQFLDSYVPETEYYRSIAEKYFDGQRIVKQLIEH